MRPSREREREREMASEWAVENKEERLREEDYCGDSSRGLAQKNILFSYNRALI